MKGFKEIVASSELMSRRSQTVAIAYLENKSELRMLNFGNHAIVY
ncbi:MAG: hypothetical protein AB4426_18315 [Xenococcaceae cyanobacterium]